MAANELTGRTEDELEELKEEHKQNPQYKKHGIPFEVAFCLNPIARQPDDYEGPRRYCCRRATRKDDYDGDKWDVDAYAVCCVKHGGDSEKYGKMTEEYLEPLTAGITHGTYAADKHLKMDFDEDEQKLYDSILKDWPEIYDWPTEDEDPARYRILRRVAVNEVRGMRQEDYLDDHEVHVKEIPTENGVQTEEVENPLAREYRLLMSEVTDQMRELGLTPKERQKMDTLESQAEKDDKISDIASDALDSDDSEYDPTDFDT